MERFFAPIKQSLSDRAVKKTESKSESPHVVFLDLQKNNHPWILFGLGLFGVGVLFLGWFIHTQWPRFLPGTTIENISVGGETVETARIQLEKAQLSPPEHTIELLAQDIRIASTSAEVEARYEYQRALEFVLEEQRAHWGRWLAQLLFSQKLPETQYLPIFYDTEKLRFMVESLRQEFDTEPHYPDIRLRISGAPQTLAVDAGADIFVINTEKTVEKLQEVLATSSSHTILNTSVTLSTSSVVEQVSKQLTQEEQELALSRGQKLIGKALIFNKDHLQQTLNDIELVSLLAVPEGYDQSALESILNTWTETFDRPPQNAEFSYDSETLRVTHFKPPRNGLALDTEAMNNALIATLIKMEQADENNTPDGIWKQELIVAETPPEVTLADTNDLGIRERIGFGESYYHHSIPNRIHNVSFTAQRINLSIIAPGKEFSFNQALGDVSAATGFRSAYVIKDGRTSLGDGGGVCQVSTTLFRALLDAGLNITRRLQHSYRVSYYELDNQPGFDATVYAGNVDLRFVNDTDHHVLVYTEADPENLHMFVELYGTSDGRTTEITNYQSWDYRPPLPNEYIPDPSLPPGRLQQVDWSASGIKTQFTHIVRDAKGNVMSEKNYYSNYRPWSAKFLQGI